ncbi:translation initiation factor IF-2 [Leptolyngbya sp. NK1-12]|uniref:Translation initiation factor IF-2 n=1 Tax=Leptolyngbya sp. NK1-12 TaxID=2547451 RepID=A0AA96WCR0_9CYAN|nr:translation initiation factor IF-2 [Leptolyngbya sp. NK1-12]
MNNGKVRIYELSKELNLDNREILAVCDQLNISVKSHSSTITEAEAARIRSAAEKVVSSHPPSKAVASHATSSGSKKANSQPPVKKQQILEIRKNRPLSEPPRRPEAETPVNSAANVAPAKPAVAQPAQQPSPPNRPVRSEAVEAEQLAEEDIDLDLEAGTELVETTAPELVEEVTVEPEEELPAEPATELVQPPVRPVAAPKPEVSQSAGASPSRPSNQAPGSVNRPILKRPKADTAQPAARTNGQSADAAPARQPRRSETAEEPALKARPVLELRRKPVRPGETASETETAAKSPGKPAGKPGDVLPELQRPTLPRPPKRGKAWEEEEEVEEEVQKAGGKAATKSKRRTPVIDDDEDIDIIDLDEVLDDEDEGEDEDATVQVSLSLARPPKPKNRAGQSKPSVSAPAPPRAKRSSESSRSTRRERRQEEVRQRPEQIVLRGGITVHDLAEELVVPETELIRLLFMKGIAANINQILDIPTAIMVAEEFGVEVETAEAEAEARKVTEMLDATDLENLQRRPPVVTIMGHVDHGKTTLLDSIRKTKVAQGEAGGITQHIGAYHVDVEQNGQVQQVVFLDTPGHEAFTAMRARGARVTDIAVLVVAADDGVRPQTVEAISHAKAAGVPIVVAINKIDKEEAQPDRVKQELTEYGLVAEEWGGDTIMVPVSAIQGENLDALLEMILLVAEVEDLYANPDRPAKGTVIEAHLDKAKGPVASLIVQNGTLRVGDVLVAGSVFGKVRAMVDDRFKRVDAAGPSFAVEVLGLSDVPAAGDEFEVYLDEKEARAIASSRSDQQRQSRLQQAMASRRVSLNTLSAQAQEGELKELNLILKADVQGSVEAILGALQQLPQKEVQVRVLLAAPGEITETDVDLAAASSAVIVGFNTTFASGARQAADEAGVDVRDYNIIYKLLEDIQGAMEGLLEPEMVEEPLGEAEVRAVFPVGRGAVAGCYILSGKAIRNSRVRVRRGGEVVYEGNLDSLKRMKEDVREVNAGYECGIGIDSFKDWALGDIIQVFRLVSKRRTLSA